MSKKETNSELLDRQMADISKKLKEKGINILHLTEAQLRREQQLWRINETQRVKRENLSEEDKLIDLFFD